MRQRSNITRQVLAAAVVCFAIAGCNKFPAAAAPTLPAPSAPTPNAANISGMAKEIFDDVNSDRAARGLPALNWNPQLAEVAGSWNSTMFQTGSFKHRNLNLLFNDSAFDHFEGLGENIYKASGASFSSGSIHVAWMRSDGHRKNVLSPSFDSIGISVLCAPDGSTWATENFGREVGSSLPALGTSSTPPVDPIVVSSETGTGC